MRAVDDVISRWTEKEREQFKDLIEESRRREYMLNDMRSRAQEGVKEITIELKKFGKRLEELNKQSHDLLDLTYGNLLRLVSKDKMPRT
jgi:septal ring factor EnvC (AmiA/AmiB activator)